MAMSPSVELRHGSFGSSTGNAMRWNLGENAVTSVEPFWWSLVGLSFIRGIGEGGGSGGSGEDGIVGMKVA
jgi:hypothetical protein